MKRLHFVGRNWRKEISYVVREFSSVKIHYSVNRITDVYVFSNKISLKRYFIEKNLNFIYSILWNVVTVCFAAI